MAIDTMDHFYVMMKFSKHECNSQLSYPDHSGYHNINLQMFIISLVYYLTLIAI